MADRLQRWSFVLSKLVSSVFVGLFFRLRAYGITNLPKQGGALLLSNHQSFLDPLLVGCPVPRPTFYMARDTLFRNPVFRAILWTVNAFPLTRGRPDRQAIRAAIGRLAAGELLVMFPEGTRTTDGTVGPFLPGVALLARRAAEWVVPTVIDGAFEIWPKGTPLPVIGNITVAYCKPISKEDRRNMTDEEVLDLARRRIIAMQARLRPRRGRKPLKYPDEDTSP